MLTLFAGIWLALNVVSIPLGILILLAVKWPDTAEKAVVAGLQLLRKPQVDDAVPAPKVSHGTD